MTKYHRRGKGGKKHKKHNRRTLPHSQRQPRSSGQQASPSTASRGKRRILYHCPTCRQPWYREGIHAFLKLEDQALERLAQELDADLSHLPLATCRLCILRQGAGEFSIDEYAHGDTILGYGWSWESLDEQGGHMLGMVLAADRGGFHLLDTDIPDADIVRHPQAAQAVLQWFAHLPVCTPVAQIEGPQTRDLDPNNPPGLGLQGTETWEWKGAIFKAPCQPLGGPVLLNLVIAVPAETPVDLTLLLLNWRDLVRDALQEKLFEYREP